MDPLSTDVIQLLRTLIKSIEQLEILALLRDSPQRSWTASAVFAALRSNESSIETRLTEFVSRGVLICTEENPKEYRYEPKTRELDRLIGLILQEYKLRPVLIMETIFRPNSGMSEFSDAFRIKNQ